MIPVERETMEKLVIDCRGIAKKYRQEAKELMESADLLEKRAARYERQLAEES